MTPEEWQEVERILLSAMDLPKSERSAYLGAACAGRLEIRAEVESLLAAHGEAGNFIDSAIASELRRDLPSEAMLLGRQIGSYKLRLAQGGRYDIIRELGRGGMGMVYLAQDTLLKRQVAIKSVLPPRGHEQQAWQDVVGRLIREAQASGSLHHPNIVGVYDVIQDGDFTSIVMEFVTGKTLAEVVLLGSPASPSFAITVLTQCAKALDYAHSQGIVHRDIKPMNIMLDDLGLVKITDFGVAKILYSATEPSHELAIGTLEYMAPEQLEGRPVDGATDQYALAVVAYRMLTGYRIFDAETVGRWCTLILGKDPLPASERNPALPRAADTVLARAMAKNAALRYSSCGQFLMELEQALTPPGSHTQREELIDTLTQTPKVRAMFPAWARGLGATSALAAGFVLLIFQLSNKPAKLADRGTVQPAEVRLTRTLNVKVNPKDLLNYIWIPAGTFMMGCSPGDTVCEDDERPAHKVTLTKGFWMGQTLVTQEAYLRLMGKNPSYFKGARLPVERVTWDDSQAYCWTLGMRLPTEAEWEYAARGGTKSSRYGIVGDIAWFEGNTGQTTHEVARKQPNAYGLYDMLGNVWQWVEDWYGPYEPGQKVDPSGPPMGSDRTLRGGSWDKFPRNVRVSDRGKDEPGNRNNDMGFRCVGERIDAIEK